MVTLVGEELEVVEVADALAGSIDVTSLTTLDLERAARPLAVHNVNVNVLKLALF